MTPSFVIESLANILLFLGGFFFTADTISNFNQGKSSFIETQVDITPNDMPTLSFCYATYEPDKIQIWQQILKRKQTFGGSIPLWGVGGSQGQNSGGTFDQILHEGILEQDVAIKIGDYMFTLEKIVARDTVISSSGNTVLACYKISSSWIHAGSDDIQQLVFKAGFFEHFLFS